MEQVTFLNWFEREYPGVFIHSIPNGYQLGHMQSQKAKREGMKKGPADLHVPRWQMYIEFKRVKGGKWSTEQEAYKQEVELGGGTYILAKGWEDAVKQVKEKAP